MELTICYYFFCHVTHSPLMKTASYIRENKNMSSDITIICYETSADNTQSAPFSRGAKGLFSDNAEKSIQKITASLSPEVLNNNLSHLIHGVVDCLDNISTGIKKYQLDEVELKIEINADGKIGLVGSVSTGCTGGITLKFKRETHE